MTNREFLTQITSGQITPKVIEFAKDALSKLDARNDKRRNTPTKEQIANEKIMAKILVALEVQPMVASEIGVSCGISTQKASALCKILMERKQVSMQIIKVKNKGAINQYSLVEEE